MMPHKRNPDVFELLRGKSGSAIGALTGLLATVKGLPGGYNRDLQEDRGPLLEMGTRIDECLSVLRLALKNVKFEPEACRAALEDGSTQATDLAEALVKKGIAFRDAYQAVGRLVRASREQNVALAKMTAAQAAQIDPRFDAAVLTVLEPRAAAARKNSAGGTGELAVSQQLAHLAQSAAAMSARSRLFPGSTGCSRSSRRLEMKRDFLTLSDLSKDELMALMRRTKLLKEARARRRVVHDASRARRWC